MVDGGGAAPQADPRPHPLPRDGGLLWRHLLADLRRRLELRAFDTAALQLAAAGVDVRNVPVGMKAWAAAGLPITTDDGAPGTVG